MESFGGLGAGNVVEGAWEMVGEQWALGPHGGGTGPTSVLSLGGSDLGWELVETTRGGDTFTCPSPPQPRNSA